MFCPCYQCLYRLCWQSQSVVCTYINSEVAAACAFFKWLPLWFGHLIFFAASLKNKLAILPQAIKETDCSNTMLHIPLCIQQSISHCTTKRWTVWMKRCFCSSINCFVIGISGGRSIVVEPETLEHAPGPLDWHPDTRSRASSMCGRVSRSPNGSRCF